MAENVSGEETYGNIVLSTLGRGAGKFSMSSNGIVWKATHSSHSFKGEKGNLKTVKWTNNGRRCFLHVYTDSEYQRFDGFRPRDVDRFQEFFKSNFDLDLVQEEMGTAGLNVGMLDFDNTRKTVLFKHDGKTSIEIPLSSISQCVAPGKNEIEFQFREDDSGPREDEILVEMRMHIPPNRDGEDESETWQNKIVELAGIKGVTGDAIVDLDAAVGNFLTPRGKYKVEMYESFMRMHGKTYDYKIAYKSISQMFLLPKPDNVHTCFVISLDDPIQQGQQRYPHLVMQLDRRHDKVEMKLSVEEITERYGTSLNQEMEGQLPELVAKLFYVLTKKKVFKTGEFRSYKSDLAVKCSLKASDGFLYPLRRSFFFIHKPATFIKHDDIESIEFLRYDGTGSAARSFDLSITCKSLDGDGGQSYVFSQIDKSEYAKLFAFLSTKKLRIQNKKAAEAVARDFALGDSKRRKKMSLNLEDFPENEEDEEDSDFGSGDEKHSSASDQSDDEDSDVEESDDAMEEDDAEESSKKKRKKSSKGEQPKKKAKKESQSSGTKKKRAKPKRDPNAPKQAMSAYILFTNDKRAELKENPDIDNKSIFSKLGEMWRAIGEEEKAKYTELAAKDKERYKEELKSYTPPEGYGPTGASLEGKADAKKKTKAKGKKKKDPNHPKRAKSAYQYFLIAEKKVNPQITYKDLGAKWSTVTDKTEFEKLAAEDKERYKKEMESYVPPKEEEQKDDDSSSDSSSSSDSDSESDE